jgi:tRNA 5-methylaminomethyl-2-thiouridine biosynthesis bifunctional protein
VEQTTARGGFSTTKTQPQIASIGAGIAGLSLAHALASRGYRSDLYDKTAVLAGASGNPRALIAPKLVALEKFSGNLLNLGSLFSLRYWQQFFGVVEKTGTLHILDKRAEQELAKTCAYHQDVLESLTPTQTSEHITQLNFSSIWLKQSGLLSPHALAQVILQNPAIQYQQAEVSQLQSVAGQWQLINLQHECLGAYDHVLVCSALNSPLLCQIPALKPIRGQVSWFDIHTTSDEETSNNPKFITPVDSVHTSNSAQQSQLTLPSIPLTYGGYMAQISQAKGKSMVLLGASFIRQDAHADVRLSDHQHNLTLIQTIAPELTHRFPAISTWQGRAAIRAQSPDYLPLAGRIAGQHGLWTLTGLGSKGFSFAPLCAELICAQLLGEAWPVSSSIAAGINPNRFSQARKRT